MIPLELKLEKVRYDNVDQVRLPCCQKRSAKGKCLLSLCATFCVCVLGSSVVYAQTDEVPHVQGYTRAVCSLTI